MFIILIVILCYTPSRVAPKRHICSLSVLFAPANHRCDFSSYQTLKKHL